MEFHDFIRVALAENLIDNDQYLLLVEQGDLRYAGELGDVDPRTLDAQKIILGVNDFRAAVDKLEPIEKQQLLLKAQIEEPIVRMAEDGPRHPNDVEIPIIGTTLDELQETLSLEWQLLHTRIEELNTFVVNLETFQAKLFAQQHELDTGLAALHTAIETAEIMKDKLAEITRVHGTAMQQAEDIDAIHAACRVKLDELTMIVQEARAILGKIDGTEGSSDTAASKGTSTKKGK